MVIFDKKGPYLSPREAAERALEEEDDPDESDEADEPDDSRVGYFLLEY